jgi:phage terminase large subunit-like protein
MFRVFEMNPSGEKNVRIKSILQTRYSLMTIYHKKYGTNVDELELELLKFPNAKHDDMIDSLASAVNIASIEYKPEAETIPTQDDPL